MTFRICLFYEKYDDSLLGKYKKWKSQFAPLGVTALKTDGFFSYGKAIRKQLSVSIDRRQVDIENLHHVLNRCDYDLVIPIPIWKKWIDRQEKLIESFAQAHALQNRPRLGVFDSADSSASLYWGLLPYVEIFLKCQLLRDRSLYTEDLESGFVFTEWLRDKQQFELDGWFFGSVADEKFLDRMMCGWTMGIAKYYRNLESLYRRIAKPLPKREIDLNRRFGKPVKTNASTWNWYFEHRHTAGESVSALDDCILTPEQRIPRRAYIREMTNCRAVLSPFGWGEVCYRDYEAVACGAVLIKPDMSHLECKPDIYRPFETYVPVKWDFSDLREKMQWLKDQPLEAQNIAHNARRCLHNRIAQNQFLNDIKTIVERVS